MKSSTDEVSILSLPELVRLDVSPKKPRRRKSMDSDLEVVEPVAFPLDPAKKYLVVLQYDESSLNACLAEAQMMRTSLDAEGVRAIVLVTTTDLSLRLYVQQLRGAEKALEKV